MGGETNVRSNNKGHYMGPITVTHGIRNHVFNREGTLTCPLIFLFLGKSSGVDFMKKFGVAQAAALMGVSPQFVRIGLQQGRLPFGTAVKMSSRWTYYINEEKLLAYISGDIIGGDANE